MILTLPFSRARDLNSSSSPARTVRSFIERSTTARPSSDLVGVSGGAIPAEQELADVGRHGVLAAELLGQVLADEVALEHFSGELVELVELGHWFLPTTDLALGEDLRRRGRRRTRCARWPSCSSSGTSSDTLPAPDVSFACLGDARLRIGRQAAKVDDDLARCHATELDPALQARATSSS